MSAGVGDTVAYENFDTHDIVTKLRSGKVMAYSRLGKYVDFASDGEYDTWLQRVPDLKEIDYVISVQFDWGIPTSIKQEDDAGEPLAGGAWKLNVYEHAGKSILGNVVGMTLLGFATRISGNTLQAKTFGTSVYCEIIAVGPP